MLLPAAPAAGVGLVCAAGAVVSVGKIGGGNIAGGVGGPPDDDAPELRRFAAGGLPGGELSPLAAFSTVPPVPVFRSNAGGGATVRCVGVAPAAAGFFDGTAVCFICADCFVGFAGMAMQTKVGSATTLYAVVCKQ